MMGVLSLVTGERQDAVSADLRRLYGVSLHHALTEWSAADLVNAVKHLPPDSATVRAELGDLYDWNHLAANMAELVDLMSFWLNTEYAKWIYDPDAPENKGSRRNKVKPPKEPVIPPVAYRPASIADERLAAYMKRVAEFSGDVSPEVSYVSSDEADALFDL